MRCNLSRRLVPAEAPSATPVPRITRAALVPSNNTACVTSVLSSSRASGLSPPGVLDFEKRVSEGRLVDRAADTRAAAEALAP